MYIYIHITSSKHYILQISNKVIKFFAIFIKYCLSTIEILDLSLYNVETFQLDKFD